MTINKAIEAARAYRDLATCYRVGRQPSERLFAQLKRADMLLEEADEVDASVDASCAAASQRGNTFTGVDRHKESK